MKITAINGSPKANGQSTSGVLIAQAGKLLREEIKAYRASQLVSGQTPCEALTDLLNSEALLIVSPLYVDSLPSPLIELLTRLEEAARDCEQKPIVYAVVNCGYYEAKHTELALDMIRHFAHRAGLPWGYGIGIGGGGMLLGFAENFEKGPSSSIHCALSEMAAAISNKEAWQNIFVVPKFPRFLYKAAANLGWRLTARRNGVRILNSRPYAIK